MEIFGGWKDGKVSDFGTLFLYEIRFFCSFVIMTYKIVYYGLHR